MAEQVLNFFREELFGENLTTAERLGNIRRLKLIAAALPKEAVRTTLLDLLKEALEVFSNEDEFMYALAEQLAVITPFMGGEDHFHHVMPLLLALAQVEETVVRKEAVSTMSKIVDKMNSTDGKNHFGMEYLTPTFEQLAKASWFGSRISACQMFPLTFKNTPVSARNDIKRLFVGLCHDDTPMVKRAAAEVLKDVFAVMEKDDLLPRFVLPSDSAPESILQYFWNDQTYETVRCSVVTATIALGHKLSSSEDLGTHVTPRITQAGQDRSWTVRLALANGIDQLAKRYSDTEGHQSYIAGIISDLLSDQEQEVRATVLTKLAGCIESLSAEQLQNHILSNFGTLTLDTGQNVRAALATTACKIAITFGRKIPEQNLLPIIDVLMKDESATVRLNAVQGIGDITKVLGVDVVAQTFLSTLQALIGDSQWRIRFAIVDQMPKLAKRFGLNSYTTALEPLFFAALTDNVHAVRECAMKNATKLVTMFGHQWMYTSFLPRILADGIGTADGFTAYESKENSSPTSRSAKVNGRGKPVSYLSRITVLHALLHLAASPAVKPPTVEQYIVPQVAAAMQDEVCNVRFAAIKAAGQLLKKNQVTSSCFRAKFEPVINQLLDDTDLDVRYFAASNLPSFTT